MTNPLASNADKIEIGDMVEVLRWAPYHYPRGARAKVAGTGGRKGGVRQCQRGKDGCSGVQAATRHRSRERLTGRHGDDLLMVKV